LKTEQLGSSHISGIPCETIDEHNAYVIDCKVSYSDLMEKESAIVICKKDCTNVKSVSVWGSIQYSEDSSVCKAMMHSGSYVKMGKNL